MAVEKLGNLSDEPRIVSLLISGATQSVPFSLSGKINFAYLSPTPGGTRTAKIQFTIDDGTTWIDTGVSVTTSASAEVILDSNALAAIAGLTGFKGNFRLSLNASDTLTATFFSRG